MGLNRNLPTASAQRLPDVSEMKSRSPTFNLDFRTKLRKTWTSVSEQFQLSRPRLWKPPALHPFTLSLAIIIPLALLVTLQLLLLRSQRNNGIIFAHDINALPLSQTFLYQYFPTIVAVVFSIFWAWIDLEVKRLEPYYQLSQEEGALGKDSLLLSYPFGFLPFVPIRALRQRHWTVFWASLTLVLVTWGLVPIQAGIFSVRQVTRTFPATFNVSRSFIPADKQPSTMTLGFAQSTYGIITLNETLPEYMTYDYTLAPVEATSASVDGHATGDAVKWTVPTTMYGVDFQCEPGKPITDSDSSSVNSKECVVSTGLSGNQTQKDSLDHTDPTKEFSALYVGYWSTYTASYYLQPTCPIEQNHTFYAGFVRNKLKDEDAPQNVTTVFCEMFHFEQDVMATIESVSKRPTSVTAQGSRRQLPSNKFNTTWLEMIMNGGSPDIIVRGNALPEATVPNWTDHVEGLNITLATSTQPMAAMAMIYGKRQLYEYLDWKVLAESYEKSWRLLFVRAMTDALAARDSGFDQVDGSRSVTASAVILEPTFTYIVEGLLAVVSIFASVLLYISTRRTPLLSSNPKSLASVMSLVAENDALLTEFGNLDCASPDQLQSIIHARRYKLVCEDDRLRIARTNQDSEVVDTSLSHNVPSQPKDVTKPIRPVEFSAWVSILIIGLFVALSTGVAVLFIKSNGNGLSLPSNNNIVQNILENYIPTAIATLIEPIWVLINRLLCLLQPMEQLRKCNARAKDSIDLNYNSLPPQLVVFKALRARHYVLATVCSMALLANLLAVAFASPFYHDIVAVRRSDIFQPPLEAKFVPINGSVGPTERYTDDGRSGAYQGGTGTDQFYVAESKFTRKTPLPPWTDDSLFYIPFMGTTSEKESNEDHYEADAIALGAELICTEMKVGVNFDFDWKYGINITVKSDGREVECQKRKNLEPNPGPRVNLWDMSCQTGPVALEMAFALEARQVNASVDVQQICGGTAILGYMRDAEGTCNSDRVITPNVNNSMFFQCQPRILTGQGTIQVDGNGRLMMKGTVALNPLGDEEVRTMFSNAPANLLAQANRYMFRFQLSTWHNDSFANDYINHIASRAMNNSRLLDPRRTLPTLEEVQTPLSRAYSELFAIWLGLYKERLLLPRLNESIVSVPGWRVVQEERIFLSTVSFVIAQAILTVYALVALIVFLRRPGEYLPRLPTSIASMIGLFAASDAVRDMRGTSRFGSKKRERLFEQLDHRYGYGSFVGVDGLVHIGIEKTPFVRSRQPTRKKSQK